MGLVGGRDVCCFVFNLFSAYPNAKSVFLAMNIRLGVFICVPVIVFCRDLDTYLFYNTLHICIARAHIHTQRDMCVTHTYIYIPIYLSTYLHIYLTVCIYLSISESLLFSSFSSLLSLLSNSTCTIMQLCLKS